MQPRNRFALRQRVQWRALDLHKIQSGVGIGRRHQLAHLGEIIERAQKAGDAQNVCGLRAGGFDSRGKLPYGLFGQRQDGIERPARRSSLGRDGGGLQTEFVNCPFGNGRGFEHHLRAFERQNAYLHHAKHGQGLPAIGERFTDQLAYAAKVAAARYESPQLHHRGAIGRMLQPLQGLTGLLRKQAFRGKRCNLINEPSSFSGKCGRRVLGELQCLRLLFLSSCPTIRTPLRAKPTSAARIIPYWTTDCIKHESLIAT